MPEINWNDFAKFTAWQCGQGKAKLVTDKWTKETVMLASHDGVKLETIIYRPDLTDTVPVVISRTCYPMMNSIYEARAKEYCKHGIAYVYQYCRGINNSEGIWEPNVNERKDGKSMLDWLNAQSWVECIGYLGHSYLALTGWCVADIVPEKVKTLYLTHYGTFRHTSAYQEGLFRHDVLTGWAMSNAGIPVEADYIESCKYRPQLEVDEKLWGCRLDWYRSWIQSPDRNAQYWQQGFWKLMQDIPGKVKVPVFMAEGWYDHHLGSAIETYKALPDEVKKMSVFAIGAWNHGFIPASGGYKGQNYDANDEARALDWFSDILIDKNIPDGCVKEYIIGADVWEISKQFPTANETVKMFLQKTSSHGLGILADKIPLTEETCEYVYDPEKPTMTYGAESCLTSGDRQGSLLQPEYEYADDRLTFISMPLKEEIKCKGCLKAVLKVSSDAEDTAFIAKFMEVMPDGKTYNIRTAATTLAFRNNCNTVQAYTPGSMVQVEIKAWDIAWKLQKGSRLRVDIVSSDFPQYAVHSNYPGPWAEQKETRKAKQTIYTGGKEGSYISIPLAGNIKD